MNKDNVITIIAFTGLIAAILDLSSMAVQVTIPNYTIVRIYYVIALFIYLYDMAKSNAYACRKAVHTERIIRKQQIEEDFKADYEAFRKEIHG